MKEKVKISVLVSGRGSNLQVLIDAVSNGELAGAEIVRVISSRADALALKRAEQAGIEGAVISKKDFTDEEELAKELIKTLEEANTDLIVLA